MPVEKFSISSEVFETMPDKCATCAFRPGTRANLSPITLLKARLCAQIKQPFHCHDNAVYVTPSGRVVDEQDRNRVDFIGKFKRGEYQPRPGEHWKNCTGWAELVESLDAKGMIFREGWQVLLTEKLLEVIDKAETEGEEWDEARTTREIRTAIDAVGEAQP